MRHPAFITSLTLSALLSAPAIAQPVEEGKAAGDTTETRPSPEPSNEPPPASADLPAPEPTLRVEPSNSPVAEAEVEPQAAQAEVAPMPPPLAPPPSTSSWTPVFTGSYFTRYEARSGYHDLQIERPRFLEGDAIFYRARLGIGTGLIDTGSRLKVALQATPQAAGVFGALPTTTTDASFGLHEGYLRVQGTYVRADVGRFELNYGDALVIGNLDWNEVARSFDGARLHITSAPDSLWVDAFATLEREGRLASTPQTDTHFADGDTYFTGVYAGLGPAIQKGLDLDAYALARVWPETKDVALFGSSSGQTYSRKAAAEATFGARAKQKLKLVDYRVEAGLQTGKRPDALVPPISGMQITQPVSSVLAYQADLEVGVQIVPDKLRVAGEVFYASGDRQGTAKNEGWAELYPTAHKWLGVSDALNQGGVKRTNVTGGVFRASTTPIAGLLVYADGHVFIRPEPVKAPDGSMNEGVAAVEVDMGVNYLLAKGLSVRGLYALFLPNSDIYSSTPNSNSADAAQYTEIELRYDM